MKKLLVSVLAIVGLVACSQEQTLVQSNNSGTLMEFNVAALDNATRVDPSITSTTLDAFDVWAYVDSEAGTVLTKERVSLLNGAWSYVNKQYWTPEHTYYFDAIAPVGTDNWTYNLNDTDKGQDNTIDFKNIDGTEDLIYAHKVVTTPEKFEQPMAAVGLEFNHLLSKVKFTFKNGFATDNVTVQVKDVEMKAKNTATYSIKDAKWGEVAGNEITLDYGDTKVIAAGGKCVAADERFTIPAEDQTYEVTFTVMHYNGNVCVSESPKTVNISDLDLESGKAYNFVTEINEQNAADTALLPIEFKVECVNDWNHTDVDSADAFAEALKAETSSIHVTLTQDIDVAISSLGTITGGSGEYKLGGEGTESITIDLNGKKLNIETTYWSILGAKNPDAVFTIKNGTMTSSQPTGTWNSYDLGFANCNYNFENVVFEKAIALEAANKTYNLKDVTINETHDYYAMWVSAKGQTVNIDGLTINSDGRGIKIDEQYVGAPAKVTLNVANTTFKTEEKSAILVKSVAGAEINWGAGNDITNVAADNQFAVWVDEDAAAYADKVVVNGAMVKVEGAKATVAANAEELKSALGVVGQTVYLQPTADGESLELGGKISIANGASLIGIGETPVGIDNDWGSNTFANQAHFTDTTIENIFFDDNLVIDAGIANGNVTFKNCVFGGHLAHQGVHFDSGNGTVVFEGCTFVGRNMFGSSLTKVIFNNCTFVNKKSSLTGADKWTGVNMWGKYEFNNCEFDTEATCNVKCDGVEATFTNCTSKAGEIADIIKNSNGYDAAITIK